MELSSDLEEGVSIYGKKKGRNEFGGKKRGGQGKKMCREHFWTISVIETIME